MLAPVQLQQGLPAEEAVVVVVDSLSNRLFVCLLVCLNGFVAVWFVACFMSLFITYLWGSRLSL